MIKKLVRPIFILLFCLLSITAAISAKELAVYSGAYIYNNPDLDSVAIVEFPFSFNRGELEFFKPDSNDSNWYARVFAQIDLLGLDGFAVDSVRTYFSLRAASVEEVKKNKLRIFNKLQLLVKPGIYTARLTLIDVVSKNEGTYFIDKIEVIPADKNNLSLSSFSSAYKISYVGDESNSANQTLYRNGYDIIPNPISVFAESDSALYIYGEIYNLKYSPEAPTQYQMIINILDNNKNILHMLGSRVRNKPGASAVFVEKIDLFEWGDKGHYQCEIIIRDIETKDEDTTYLPFHIVSPEEVLFAAQAEAQKQKSFGFDPYDNLIVKDKISLVTYMLSDGESRVLKTLTESGKLNYLDVYWKEHDENKSTWINENRIIMIERFKYSNDYFSTNDVKTNGYLTDRGRIHMTYGIYDERDDYEAPRVGNSYVIWFYHSYEGGLVFVFDDWSGNDEYRLIHSNATGERFDAGWDEKIKTGLTEMDE